MTGPSAHSMATFVLDTMLSVLDKDEIRFLNKVKEAHYWGSPTCARDLHDLTVLFYQAQGYQRAKENNPS